MIPICPLRDKILLFLSYGLNFLYEGFGRVMGAGFSLWPQDVRAPRLLPVSLWDKPRSILYANRTRALCILQGWRKCRCGSTPCSCICCNFHTIRMWKIATFHSHRLSFAYKVEPSCGGFSSPVTDIINSIASRRQIRGFKAGWCLHHIKRSLVTRVGSEYWRKRTVTTQCEFF